MQPAEELFNAAYYERRSSKRQFIERAGGTVGTVGPAGTVEPGWSDSGDRALSLAKERKRKKCVKKQRLDGNHDGNGDPDAIEHMRQVDVQKAARAAYEERMAHL